MIRRNHRAVEASVVETGIDLALVAVAFEEHALSNRGTAAAVCSRSTLMKSECRMIDQGSSRWNIICRRCRMMTLKAIRAIYDILPLAMAGSAGSYSPVMAVARQILWPGPVLFDGENVVYLH